MKRFILIILWVLFIIIAFIIAFFYFADPNKLKPMLINKINQHSGYPIVIPGNLHWSFYPNFSMQIDQMQFGDAQSPFLTLRKVKLAISPLDFLKKNDQLKGNVTIEQGNIDHLMLSNIHCYVTRNDSAWIMLPCKANFYKGELQGTLMTKKTQGLEELNGQLFLKKVDTQGLLNDLLRKDNKIKIKGLLNANILLSAQGNTKSALRSSLKTNVQLNIQHGAIEGLDVNDLVNAANSLLLNKNRVDKSFSQQTEFTNLEGNILYFQRIARLENIHLLAQQVDVTAHGPISFADNTLNVDLLINVPIKSMRIPVTLSGELNKPIIKIDASAIHSEEVKKEFEKVKEKVNKEMHRFLEKHPEIRLRRR